MTPYIDIFKRFKNKIEDVDLPLFNQGEQNEILIGYLDAAIAYIELDGLKIENDLSDRDNELMQFNKQLKNCEMEVIAMYMVVAWYEPKINSLENTVMFIGSKNDVYDTRKEHMKTLKNIQSSKRLEARKYFTSYNYKHNDKLIGGNNNG